MNFLIAIWQRIVRTVKNDIIAFVVGVAMWLVWLEFKTIANVKMIAGAGWVIAGYFATLFYAAAKGEKISLEKSLKLAIANTKTKKITTTGTTTNAKTEDDIKPEADKPEEKPESTIKRGIQFIGDFLSDEQKVAQSSLDIVTVEKTLKSKIKGQDHAIEAVVSTLKRAAAGIRVKPESPLCVFLLLGATGTGKTEIVKQISKATGRPLVRFDMPNFSSDAGIWELIGSPTGYVGSDRPGRLVSEIVNNPDAVLLLDEIEKANPKIWDPFLSILDEGRLKGQGDMALTANFKNVLVFMTSNLLQYEDTIEDEAKLRNEVLMSGYFRPEILNRIDRIIMFKRFTSEVMREIVQNMLVSYVDTFQANNKLNAEISIDAAVVEHVLSNIDLKFGVRDAQRYIDKHLGDALANYLLSARQQNRQIITMHIYCKDKKILIKE